MDDVNIIIIEFYGENVIPVANTVASGKINVTLGLNKR